MTIANSDEPVIGPGMALRNCRYGTMLYPANDTYIGRSLELYGEYSPFEVDFYAYVLRPGDGVIDAGANIGALTTSGVGDLVGPSGTCHGGNAA